MQLLSRWIYVGPTSDRSGKDEGGGGVGEKEGGGRVGGWGRVGGACVVGVVGWEA